MKEIEILVQVFDGKKAALAKLRECKRSGTKRTFDLYFFDPKRTNLKPGKNARLRESFRLRKQERKNFLTYKVDHFDNGAWTHSDEHETEIDDFDIAQKILAHLGLKPLVKIESEKHIFLTDDYEIVLEDVKNLGLFLEVEALAPSPNVTRTKKRIWKFISSLKINVSKELNAGKPELLLRKKKDGSGQTTPTAIGEPDHPIC